jgi:purine-cytosine permease-like protein
MLDIRIPIGLMFSILGAILVVFGVVSWYTNRAIYVVHCFDINVNLAWGCVLLAFGIFMLMLAYVGSQRAKKRNDSK